MEDWVLEIGFCDVHPKSSNVNEINPNILTMPRWIITQTKVYGFLVNYGMWADHWTLQDSIMDATIALNKAIADAAVFDLGVFP